MMSLIQSTPITSDQILAYHRTKEIAIIQTEDNGLIAACSSCEAFIHWDWEVSVNGWMCSNVDHAVHFNLDNEDSAVHNSVCSLHEPLDFIQTWIAFWLEVPVDDVQVDIA